MTLFALLPTSPSLDNLLATGKRKTPFGLTHKQLQQQFRFSTSRAKTWGRTANPATPSSPPHVAHARATRRRKGKSRKWKHPIQHTQLFWCEQTNPQQYRVIPFLCPAYYSLRTQHTHTRTVFPLPFPRKRKVQEHSTSSLFYLLFLQLPFFCFENSSYLSSRTIFVCIASPKEKANLGTHACISVHCFCLLRRSSHHTSSTSVVTFCNKYSKRNNNNGEKENTDRLTKITKNDIANKT